MTKAEFIAVLNNYLDKTGMSDGSYYNAYLSVGDDKSINTAVYIDEEGFIWITANESVKRIKTSINVQDVVELRYSQFGNGGGRFFVICSNYAGLDFCEGEIGYFENGYYGKFNDAFEWFTNDPVS